MRLPRVRFTVRAMMALVAAAALLAGGQALRHRSRRLEELGDRHFRASGRGCVLYRDLWGRDVMACDSCSLGRGADSGPGRAEGEWHALMARRYYEAAARPWLPVEVAAAPAAAQ